MTRKRPAILLILVFVGTMVMIGSPLFFARDAQAAEFWQDVRYNPPRAARNVGYFNCLFNLTATHYDSIAGHGKVIPSTVWRDGVGGRTYRNADEFVARLQTLYGTGGQNHTGVAFLVKAMLGYTFCPGGQAGPSTNRSISAAQWTDFRNRLRTQEAAGNINWNHRGYDSPTTTLGSNKFVGSWSGVRYNLGYDVAAVNFRQIDDAITISTPNGTVVIFYSCGNPPANRLAALPVADYTLTPTMSVSPDSAEGGTTATLSPSVSNSGSTDSPSVGWHITNFNVDRNGTIPGGHSNSTQTPDDHYGNGAAVIQSSSGVFTRDGVTSITANPHTMPDVEVGTRICYALSVSPYNQSTGTNWRHSPPDCVTIAKKPKVQVLGSDLIVGKGQTSNIVTSSTTKGIGGSNQTFGSWGEYGIIASGRVTSMASGAGYSGGATSNVFCGVSLLTFSNVNTGQTSCSSASQMGGYANTKSLPDVGSRLNTSSSLGVSPTVNLASISTGSYAATGNVRVSASGPIVSGKWVVINAPTATVTINSDINYTTSTLDSLGDIPQVVIIANQIRIAGSVTNIDAWLIASGTAGNLFTCSDVATASELRSGNCDQRLTVNGPVMAKHLYLYRTAGAGTGNQTGDPAEVFNLRPDAYLWATGYLSDDGRLQTVTTKELPPRF
jgi:hypothetical protein